MQEAEDHIYWSVQCPNTQEWMGLNYIGIRQPNKVYFHTWKDTGTFPVKCLHCSEIHNYSGVDIHVKSGSPPPDGYKDFPLLKVK